MAKRIVVAVLAVVVIGVAAGYVLKGCSRSVRSQPSDDKKYWVLLTMGGFFQCPHCKERVDLTEEQLKMPAPPPDFKCPHCGKAVDIVELMKPRKPAAKTPPAR